jgi:xylose dehydrogenase (NAD/NADP)
MLEASSVDLIGVASRTPDKAEVFRSQFNLHKAYPSYEEMLDDPQIQAVYIPLPNGMHAEWMTKAAERGKHSLCEKPFTSNAQEARVVADVANRNGVLVMEAFMWRLHSQHLRARLLINEGVIGTVQHVRGAFSFTLTDRTSVRLSPELAGGCTRDIGCYPISAARYYFAAEPTIAYARGNIPPEHGIDMRVSAILDFPEGFAAFDCAFDLPYRTQLEIVGDKGSVEFPKPWQPDLEATIIINGQAEKIPRNNQYVKEFEHFSRCILGEEILLFGAKDAILQMQVIDAVLRSLGSGLPEPVSSGQ